MGACNCSPGRAAQEEQQTVDAAKGKDLLLLPGDELLVPEPEVQNPDVELEAAKGSGTQMLDVDLAAAKAGNGQVLAPLLEPITELTSQTVTLLDSHLPVAGQDSHLPVAGYQSTFGAGTTISGQQSSLNPVKPGVTGTSCVQHDCLQTLLATRLEKKPGKNLRIQDVSPTFQDRMTGSCLRRPSSIGTTLDRYIDRHQQAFTELLELEANPQWTFKKRHDSVDIFTCYDARRQGTCFKGVTDMRLKDGGLFYFLENMLDAGKRPEWDELCIHGEILEQFLPYYRVSYFQMASPARSILADRDALLLARFRFEGDGTLLVSVVSSTHPGKPEVPEFVRLNFICGGYIVRKTSDESLYQVTFLGSADPKGWVPEFVKNIVAWKQAQVLSKFKSRYKV